MPPAKLHAVYAFEPLPQAFTASLFLAGDAEPGWRLKALEHLTAAGFDGAVVLPQGRGGAAQHGERLHTWTAEALRHADAVLFWMTEEAARDPVTVEQWGAMLRSARAVLGVPGGTPNFATAAAARHRIPVAPSLGDAVQQALALLRPGALRRGGERAVPLLLWRSPSFQSWYRALRGAGQRLDDAQLEWSYRPRAPGRPPLLWALRPRIYLPGERRHMGGEVVIGRTDVSATVLYVPPAPSASGAPADPLDALVVLVREFRSAVRNSRGFVWMLPGGSAAQASEREQDARATAVQEIAEETGLRLRPADLEPLPHGARQVAATLSSHHGYLFRAALTAAQLAELRATEQSGVAHGANPNERCFVTLRSIRDLLGSTDVDWSQLGMILFALLPRSADGPTPAR